MTSTTRTGYCSLPAPAGVADGKARVCIASPDISGPIKNGGIGSAYKALAMALARGGHEVTILYPHGTHSDDGPISRWIEFYAAHGIKFIPLSLPACTTLEGSKAMSLSYIVFEYFRTCASRYDVVHFPEWLALGYYSILGKKQALILRNSTIVLGLHSPHLWNMRYNNEPVFDADILTLDFMERQCAALADVVVSPSAYMVHWCQSQGWTFPRDTYVQPYVVPPGTGLVKPGHAVQTAITEIVFFGRLDIRKGLHLFCDAIHQSHLRNRPDVTVVFLGRSADINGLNSAEVVRRRSKKWQCPVKLITDLGRDEAVEYLRGSGRLAVIASLADNSPNTVYECLSNGIAFIALRTGGIPEVIAAEDWPRVLCDADVAALAVHLEQALDNPLAPAHPAMDFSANEETWNRWHAHFAQADAMCEKATAGGTFIAKACATEQKAACTSSQINGGDATGRSHWPSAGSLAHLGEKGDGTLPMDASAQAPLLSVCLVQHGAQNQTLSAIGSLHAQDYASMQFILLLKSTGGADNGNLVPEEEKRLLADGWKILYFTESAGKSPYDFAAHYAQGAMLLLMDDSVCLAPHALRTLVNAMQAGTADILTSAVGLFKEAPTPDDNAVPQRIRLFSGSPAAGLYRNVFGGHAVLMTAAAYKALGGFRPPTQDSQKISDHAAWWAFYARAALSPLRMQCIPIPVLRACEAEHTDTGTSEIEYLLADIYRQQLDPKLSLLPLFARGMKRKADMVLPLWTGQGPVRIGLRREIAQTMKDIRRKTRRIRYIIKGKPLPGTPSK